MLLVLLLFVTLCLADIPVLIYNGNTCPDIACNVINGIALKSDTLTRVSPPDENGITATFVANFYDPTTGERSTKRVCANNRKKKEIRSNRYRACGKVKCGPGLECDEYPFASSYEGGVGASTRCIPSWQNGNAGNMLGTFLTKNNIPDHGPYKVSVINPPADCSILIIKSTPDANANLCN